MKTVTIGKIAEQIRGVSYAKGDATDAPKPGFSPILRANNIGENGLNFASLVYVPDSKIKGNQRIQPGDVVIAASSGSIDVVGKAAKAAETFDGAFGAFCKVLRPNGDVDPGYFAQFFKTRAYRQRISSLAAGANINNLKNEHLDNLEILLPPLEEQKRIAAILDAADELRTKRRESLAQLDPLLQSTFLDLFGDPVTNPKKWEEKLLSEVVRPGTIVTYGIVQAGDEFPGGIPYIRTGDIVNGEIVEDGLRHTNPAIASKFERSRVDTGDIVMSIRATVGTTAVVPPSLDGANLTQGTARIAPGPHALLPFLLHYLRSHGAQRWIQRQVKGATFKEITLGRLRELPVLLPPIGIQKKFGEIVAQIEERRLLERNQLDELDHLFASLQSRAFRGEL